MKSQEDNNGWIYFIYYSPSSLGNNDKEYDDDDLEQIDLNDINYMNDP